MDRNEILLQILREEIRPSFGCSGPIGVALAACEAADGVGGTVQSIHALIDKDMCAKNSDVGIPPSGVKGLRAALALGALYGKAGTGLQVLNDVTPEQVATARAFASSGQVEVVPDWETRTIGVYAEVVVRTDRGEGCAIVAKTHSNLVYKKINGKVVLDKGFSRESVLDESKDAIRAFSVSDLVAFSKEINGRDLAFLQEAIELNNALCRQGLSQESQSSGFGRSLMRRYANIPIKKAKAMTCAAAESRMNGCALAAMSCATSGNAGIAVSLPLISLAQDYGIEQEMLLRALACGYLVTISCKNKIGRHSAMCACAVGASLGVAAGTTVLFGGTPAEVDKAINSTMVNVFGILCDGAREACALKLATAAECGMDSAFMALDGVNVRLNEGVCGGSADDSMSFMGQFARDGMIHTDLTLCRALYGKKF